MFYFPIRTYQYFPSVLQGTLDSKDVLQKPKLMPKLQLGIHPLFVPLRDLETHLSSENSLQYRMCSTSFKSVCLPIWSTKML